MSLRRLALRSSELSTVMAFDDLTLPGSGRPMSPKLFAGRYATSVPRTLVMDGVPPLTRR